VSTLAGVLGAGAVVSFVIGAQRVTASGANGRASLAVAMVQGSMVVGDPPGGPVPSATTLRRRQAKRRARMVDAQVPQLLDLLASGSSAGLSAQLALRRSVEAMRGPIAEDLAGLIGRADLGASWRLELERYARGVGSVDLARAVAVLERTDRLGSSLMEATGQLATSVRQARRAAVLERARTAPIKMLFPLVFLILPAFLLLTVVPVLLTTVRSIG